MKTAFDNVPIHIPGVQNLPLPDDRAVLDHMPGSEVPVMRQPFQAGDMLPMWAGMGAADKHFLFDLDVDPHEQENRFGEPVEKELRDLLVTAMQEVEAPAPQFERLGL